jgi:phage gpG-like protein
MKQAGPVIVGNAVKDRFTSQRGPFPVSEHKLGRRTGRLRQSITNTPPQINSSNGEVTMGFGSNVSYFAVHEFGFKGTVQVKAHKRRNGQAVRAHSKQATYAARAPMRTELETNRTTKVVIDAVTRAAKKALDRMEGGRA